MNMEEQFSRICTKCGNEMTYKSKLSCDKSEAKNVLCRSCRNIEMWKTRDKTTLIEMNRSRKGKTAEEIFGEEKASQLKASISSATKGRTYEEIYGADRVQEQIAKRASAYETLKKQRAGKTAEEIYGEAKAKDIKAKLSQSSYFNELNPTRKGKTWEESFGETKGKEMRVNRSLISKHGFDKYNAIFKNTTYDERYTFEVATNKRRKARLSVIKRIEATGLPFQPFYNTHACNFFDYLNEMLNWNGQHALNNGEYRISELGYHADFYEPALNMIIEWNEGHHYNDDNKQFVKDIVRTIELREAGYIVIIIKQPEGFKKDPKSFYDPILKEITKRYEEAKAKTDMPKNKRI